MRGDSIEDSGSLALTWKNSVALVSVLVSLGGDTWWCQDRNRGSKNKLGLAGTGI
jgi:hypothetical protein